MPTLTKAESELTVRNAKSHEAIFASIRAREKGLSRLLMAYISSGLVFMLLPGTFLGVWNLIQISGHESLISISPAWIQAHGQAQVLGWIGSFILGIGFYSIPKLRADRPNAFGLAWLCWVMWIAGVALRWLANVYLWNWRVLLPVSGLLGLAAFAIFFRAVSQHRPVERGAQRWPEPWMLAVLCGTFGLLLVLVANFAFCLYLGLFGEGPAIPHGLDQRFLALMAWGFLAPTVWGFSAKWMGVFIGLKSVRPKFLLVALGLSFLGVALAVADQAMLAATLFLAAAALAIVGLRMFEPAERPAKTRGVHRSFPFFIRSAYCWLLVAAFLGIAAALWDSSGGIWGASRHAFTVGFIAVMVLSVGSRILPAFAGMRLLWSPRLMFAALALLSLGCTLRVSCEVLAYQDYASWAWRVLPVSAVLELAGVTAFAINIFGTFIFEPSHAAKDHNLIRVQQ